MKIYSIYDNVAKEYSDPFVAKNDGVAIRKFDVSMESLIAQGSKDYVLESYSLFCLGSWDSDNGVIVSIPPVVVTTFEDDFEKDNGDDK